MIEIYIEEHNPMNVLLSLPKSLNAKVVMPRYEIICFNYDFTKSTLILYSNCKCYVRNSNCKRYGM